MFRRRFFPAVWMALILSVCANFAPAQEQNPHSIDASRFGQRITLGPEWLFSPGDNPAWAEPGFDDSNWATVSTNKDLFEYGYHDIPYAWYRVHIHLRPGTRNLMVGLFHTLGSYEVYANGIRIGGNGPFPPEYRFDQDRLTAYPVPDDAITPKGDLVLAIRFGFNATGRHGHGTAVPIYNASGVYLLSAESAGRESVYASRITVPFLILAGLGLLTGLVALALFAVLRSQREYLAAAIHMFSWSAYYSIEIWWNHFFAATFRGGLLLAFFFGVGNVSLVEFVRLVLGLRRSRWIIALEIVFFLAGFSAALLALPFWPYYFGVAAYSVPMLVADVFLAALLVRAMLVRGAGHERTPASTRASIEARVLLPAVLLITFGDYWVAFNYLSFYLFHFAATFRGLPSVHLGSYSIPVLSVGDFFSFITVLLFLVLRTVGIARRQARALSELEAAREVQQQLVPAVLPALPGFTLSVAYRPAAEVGGDFYQVIKQEERAFLVVIGDVSGKGLKAAMTSALALGALRALAAENLAPAQLMRRLNGEVTRIAGGGFITCLCACVAPNGTVTLANAGHLAPYRNGEEIVLEHNLPLGVSSDAEYGEVVIRLAPGESLTLLSDGVVEARNARRELFGFERAARLSAQPAESVAQAAQAFGQEDDITVLTVAFAS
jgi:phosphoserine phosphatase RsbU/P